MLIQSNACEFNKSNGVLNFQLSSDVRFPDTVSVQSAKTGKVVQFVQDHEMNMNNEFYDGMQCAYRPTENCGVSNLFLFYGM